MFLYSGQSALGLQDIGSGKNDGKLFAAYVCGQIYSPYFFFQDAGQGLKQVDAEVIVLVARDPALT